jgi:hypothetical protein
MDTLNAIVDAAHLINIQENNTATLVELTQIPKRFYESLGISDNLTHLDNSFQIRIRDFNQNISSKLNKISINKITIDEFNSMERNNVQHCLDSIIYENSKSYLRKRNKCYIDILTWIQMIPDQHASRFAMDVIQPNDIVMYINEYAIPNCKKLSVDISGNTVASDSYVNNICLHLSKIMSTIYGRNSEWTEQNIYGNPLDSPLIKSLKNGRRKSKKCTRQTVKGATAITKKELKRLIDYLDVKKDVLKKNYEILRKSLILNAKEEKELKSMKIQLILLKRDIMYYLYLFLSSQRGGDACHLTIADMITHRDVDSDKVACIEVFINKTKTGAQGKISFIPIDDAIDNNPKYCFVRRYNSLKKMCEKDEDYIRYDPSNVMFPTRKSKYVLDYSKSLTYNTAYKALANHIKDFCEEYEEVERFRHLTLHSFRRGSIQNFRDQGEDPSITMKRGLMKSNSTYVRYADKDRPTKFSESLNSKYVEYEKLPSNPMKEPDFLNYFELKTDYTKPNMKSEEKESSEDDEPLSALQLRLESKNPSSVQTKNTQKYRKLS